MTVNVYKIDENIEKAQKKRHQRTSKTGKVFFAGSGSNTISEDDKSEFQEEINKSKILIENNEGNNIALENILLSNNVNYDDYVDNNELRSEIQSAIFDSDTLTLFIGGEISALGHITGSDHRFNDIKPVSISNKNKIISDGIIPQIINGQINPSPSGFRTKIKIGSNVKTVTFDNTLSYINIE